jgi:small multidrug resistance pump
MALRRIELSIAYAIWSAVGTSLIAVIGIVLFKETVTVVKVLSLVLVVAGVVGLKLSEPPGAPATLRAEPSADVNGLDA